MKSLFTIEFLRNASNKKPYYEMILHFPQMIDNYAQFRP